MTPTPFGETNFRENLLTSLIPIQHKTSNISSSHLSRDLVNNATHTDIQKMLKQSILQAKRDFEDYAESQRNLFSTNFKNQLNKQHININEPLENSMFMKPFNDFHIIRKGPFFQDPFFEECRRQFEKSVEDIVTKFGLGSSVTSTVSENVSNNDINANNGFMNNAFKSYRNLRETQLQEENQASSLVHEDHQHKIVIDVKDFMSGEIKVNSFNNTIRIEGHQEASSQSPKNSSSSKRNFCKEFTLPGSVNMESVKSSMSSDGILTITVPRSQPDSTATLSKESDMMQSPSQMAQPPAHMPHSPSHIAQSPSQMTHLPSHLTQSPSQMTQSPSQMAQSPPEITHLPSQMTQSPLEMAQSINQLAHSPSYLSLAHTQMVPEPSQLARHLTVQELSDDEDTESNCSHITQSTNQLAHSPSYLSLAHTRMIHEPSQLEKHLTIQELPNDGHTDTNGATSQNYVTYPEEVNVATCPSYRRKPNGGYWTR